MAPELVSAIEREYDRGAGFVGQLRDGRFDEAALARLLGTLRDCPSADAGGVDAELVRLLWFMPWVVEWQRDRLVREGKDADNVRQAGNAIFSELERILGIP